MCAELSSLSNLNFNRCCYYYLDLEKEPAYGDHEYGDLNHRIPNSTGTISKHIGLPNPRMPELYGFQM